MVEKIGKAERLLVIIRFFQKREIGTVTEIAEYLACEGFEVNRKSIQRDLNLLSDYHIIDYTDHYHSERIWEYLGMGKSSPASIRIQQNEMLSYYMLKAYIRQFQQTVIEEGIQYLDKKLEKLFPGEVFQLEAMLWNKNVGYYDYTQSDHIIRRLINFIAQRQWTEAEYKSSNKGKTSTFKCLPRTMFENKGNLYVVAFTCGKVDEHRVLLLQNIIDINPCPKVTDKVLPFDYNKWSTERFGVFHGERGCKINSVQ